MSTVVLFVVLGFLAWRAARWLATEWAPPYDEAMRRRAEAMDALERAHRRVSGDRCG